MGWFFNRNNDNSNTNNQYDSTNNSESSYHINQSFYSKKRSCQNDPEDDRFLICKTIIKDDHGTREEQQRIPINDTSLSNINSNNFSMPHLGSISPFKSSVQDDEKTFNKFQSFFIQPSFFDFHNADQSNSFENQDKLNKQVQSYQKSYTQSSSCHTDPEDRQYLICKSKVYDGNETKQVEQRIKLSDQFGIPSFKTQFNKLGHQIDQQMHNLMKDMNLGFNFIMPFVGSMMNFAHDIQNLQKNANLKPNQQYFPKNQGYDNFEKNKESKNQYFNSNKNKKDTNIYDL